MSDSSLSGMSPVFPGRLIGSVWVSGFSRQLAFRREELRTLGIALLLNFLLFGLVLVVATPGYETNDDLGMQLVASGFYTGQPSEYLIFTHILIGWVLRGLYESWQGPNWYFLYLVTVHFVSLTAMAFVVLSRKRAWSAIGLYAGFFALVETRILIDLQFTTTAFIAGVGGMLLLVDGLEPGRPPRWLRVLAGVALITLMGMIRVKVAPLLAIVAFPFLLERFGISGWRRLAGAALICGILFVAVYEINRWAYERDPGWAEFREYNQLRGKIHDMPVERLLPQAAHSVGWTENDAWMFAEYYFSDPDVFAGASRMRKLVKNLETFSGSAPASLHALPMDLPFRWTFVGRHASVLLKIAVLNAGWLLFFAGAQRQRFLVTLLVYYGLIFSLDSYLLTMARLPERVSYNLPLFVHAVLLYWAMLPTQQSNRSRWREHFKRLCPTLYRSGSVWCMTRMVFLGWVALYALFSFRWCQNLTYTNAFNSNLKDKSHRIFKPVEGLLSEGAKPILISMPPNSNLRLSLAYRHSPSEAPFYLVPYGCATHSPLFRRTLHRYGLDPYSLSVVSRSDVFFLMEKRWLEPLKSFYREHFDMEVQFEMVFNADEVPEYRNCGLYLYQGRIVRDEVSSPAAVHTGHQAFPEKVN